MDRHDTVKKLSSCIAGHFSRGLIPDRDTIGFINSAYGLNETGEISHFIEHGDDRSDILDMVSYPPDRFRQSIEELIPDAGLSPSEIEIIENSIYTSNNVFILFAGKKIVLNDDESLFCCRKFIRRLNLDISLNFFYEPDNIPKKQILVSARCVLRKKKFSSGGENSRFLADLIHNYNKPQMEEDPELLNLIIFSADLFNRSEKRPMEILTEKKYFYENAVNEAAEFGRMFKTYTMEFIMMQKIQPPLISAEEARLMIRLIDRVTFMVYGMIIPSTQNIILEDYQGSSPC